LELIKYKTVFLEFLKKEIPIKEPVNLYNPIDYILQIGGKRLRPISCLMACKTFSNDFKKALPAALSIEIFHNFTLLHDDVMDHAELRRGKQTVHKKWDLNTAILSGDAMLILAYKFLEKYEGDLYKSIMQIFNKTALQVCEGQQYDVDFENRDDVTIDEYKKMITNKTAVLLASSLQIGAFIGKASNHDAEKMYKFGLNLGIAFQLQDDYLDTFGDVKTFGKKIGGDIIENKKTFLFLKLIEVISNTDKKTLDYVKSIENEQVKIDTITALYIKYNIPKLVIDEIKKYTELAYSNLEGLSVSNKIKQDWIDFGEQLMQRKV
jgi:geranylgeranyl diphosphate synthase type II